MKITSKQATAKAKALAEAAGVQFVSVISKQVSFEDLARGSAVFSKMKLKQYFTIETAHIADKMKEDARKEGFILQFC